MEVIRAFGVFVVDLAKSVDNLSPAIKKELYPFTALILTILFVRAHYISHYRLAWKSQRKAALHHGGQKAEIQQVRFAVVGPVVLLAFFGFAYFYAFSGPHVVGLHTLPQVLLEKVNNTQICERAMETGNLQVAEKAVRNKAVGAALFKVYKDSHVTLASLVGTLANFCIIYTGAMFSILPFLVLMVIHTLLYPVRFMFKEQIWGLNTRFFDVCIPVVNIVTVISLLVFFVFHLLVDTWRAENCLWTSGHWYTYVITTLCFVFVLTHLFLNEPEKFAAPYVGWFAFQQFLSFSALRETQMFFHSMAEALDGVRYALLLFPLLVLLGGYIARRQCQPPSVSPLESAKKTVETVSEASDAVENTAASRSLKQQDEAHVSKSESPRAADDYVHVTSPQASSTIPSAPALEEDATPELLSPQAPEAPEAPDAPDTPVAAPKLPPKKGRKAAAPKPPGGPSEPQSSSGARFDPSVLGEQLQQQRARMKKAERAVPERPLEGLALQLRNIRALVNPDAGLEEEADEEEWS